ncbi:hypothetical protein BC777_3035 [Yoonia maricola]|uniref:Lipoprotein n=1 Tax=Yoonia maricola TaxID=420999 RepID=A0A2M8W290_9RHOB|nr:hypothetical protein [Yoonia maricola]PJI85039.1 hypothetical protein BC777_3035 [Yoonia maricola]
MRRLILGSVIALAACEGGTFAGGGGAGMREFMVIGGRMSFEDCRARGGLIIRDSNTAMVACDPSIRREPVPADEFDHPDFQPAG